ncbi:MAG: sigma-70 family RNA polymerase sigma factor [Clostridiales bacterium]|nr:sigma-70 family RNA polymerase sigma factor [Clostridiales bacterium]
MSDEDRFPSIYERYMPLLRTIAGSRGIPYDEIDDIVQEAFVSYYRHYPLTWEDSRIQGYLSRIVRNLCTDYQRRNRPGRSGRAALSELAGQWAEVSRRKDPLAILLERQEYQAVAGALASMKKDWAAVMFLYVVEERPISEVSEILGISEAACRMRLCRGRRYLRRQLGRKPQRRR